MIILIGALAVVLTYCMFSTRQSMLAFPAAIFWMIFGADAYGHSVYTWDIYYLLFFASCIGMVLFCILAGFGLREKRDTGTDEDEFIDEKGSGTEQYYGESKVQARRANASDMGDDLPPDSDIDKPSRPSQRTRDLRKRAQERKTSGAKKKFRWGEFK